MTQWTKPYYGVQHLCSGEIQVTVNEYPSLDCNVYALNRDSSHCFTPVKEHWVRAHEGGVEEARRIGERWLEELTR